MFANYSFMSIIRLNEIIKKTKTQGRLVSTHAHPSIDSEFQSQYGTALQLIVYDNESAIVFYRDDSYARVRYCCVLNIEINDLQFNFDTDTSTSDTTL